MRWSSRAAIALGSVLFLIPRAASAHAPFLGMGSFWAGVLHPLTAFDETGFVVGLAIWAGLQRRRRDIGVVGAAFAGCFCGALAIGWSGHAAPGLAATAGLMIVVGLAGAARRAAGIVVLAGIAALGGAVLGGAGADGSAGVSLPLFALGAATATASLLSWGLIAVTRAAAAWMQIGWRASASWIAAIGLMSAALEGARLFGHR
jgi:urease accessory protein